MRKLNSQINSFIYRVSKRLFDIVAALFFLILFMPLLLIASLIIFMETRSNPVYLQKRGLSLNKKSFTLIKLKTLKTRPKNLKTGENISSVFLKHELNQYVTPFGRWLRKTGFDEIPQFINVLIGDMSLVGPRPLSLSDLESIQKSSPLLYSERTKINSKPGITGNWQVFGNRAEGLINLIALEREYEKSKSFSLDLFLLLMTIPVVLFAKHSDAIVKSEMQTEENEVLYPASMQEAINKSFSR